MRRAGGQLAVALARRVAHEQPCALDRAGGDAGPCAAPGEMRHWHHCLRMNLLVRRGQDLVAAALGLELEAGAAGAAHAERVPVENALERIVALEEDDQNLVRLRRFRG